MLRNAQRGLALLDRALLLDPQCAHAYHFAAAVLAADDTQLHPSVSALAEMIVPRCARLIAKKSRYARAIRSPSATPDWFSRFVSCSRQ
jgi:hypothetical protein